MIKTAATTVLAASLALIGATAMADNTVNYYDGRAPISASPSAPQAADTSGPKTREQVRQETIQAARQGKTFTSNPSLANLTVERGLFDEPSTTRSANQGYQQPGAQTPATADVGTKAE